jgi:Zn-dependent protease
MKQAPKDAAVEARVGLAGPILGSLGCLVPLGLYEATGNNLFRALAFTGFFLNLINLLPVLPLDGGRAMAALSPAMWLVGFVLLVGTMFVYPTPIAILVLLFGGFETYRRWKQRGSPEAQRYYQVKPATRFAIAVTYIGLAAVLGVGMHFTHLERTL